MIFELGFSSRPQSFAMAEPRVQTTSGNIIFCQDVFMRHQQVRKQENYSEIAKLAQHLG
jgi:hypothetical protein